jgi:hypothetical protein
LTKIQRSFTVEYKSGRRKTGAKSNSIWGDMDLKSISREIDEEAMPMSSQRPQDLQSDAEGSTPEPKQAETSKSLPLEQQASPQIAKNLDMANELEQVTDAGAPALVEVQSDPRKQRKPRRTRKVAPEVALNDIAIGTGSVSNEASGRKRRGRKAKSFEALDAAKRMTTKRNPRAAKKTKVISQRGSDEREELLLLEKENLRLRRLLAKKLRAENFELRKRLDRDQRS